MEKSAFFISGWSWAEGQEAPRAFAEALPAGTP